MHLQALSVLLLALPRTRTATATSPAPATSSPATALYRKIEDYSGPTFFDGFSTFTGPDPTAGYVDYIALPDAAFDNLTAFIWREEASAASAFVGVDYHQHLPSTSPTGRKSVRLTSKATFGVGLLTVIDVLHAPTGPGVWPAVWLLANVTGDVWPVGGELDIMEWVNDADYNAMTLHTAPGCVVERDAGAYRGRLNSTDCNAGNGSLGCSIDAPSSVHVEGGKKMATAGKAFNAQRGGVYVHEWTATGVTEWLFPHDDLPPDLKEERPDPASWAAKPLAKWTGEGCQFDQAFQQQQLIINICLCGDWAGEVWQESGMTNRTGVATCDEYVAEHPEAFREAYFEFASVKMYSSNAKEPGNTGQKRDPMAGVERHADEPGDGIDGSTDHHMNGHHRHARAHLQDRADQWHQTADSSHLGQAEYQDLSPPSARLSNSTSRSGASTTEVAGWTIGALALLIAAALI